MLPLAVKLADAQDGSNRLAAAATAAAASAPQSLRTQHTAANMKATAKKPVVAAVRTTVTGQSKTGATAAAVAAVAAVTRPASAKPGAARRTSPLRASVSAASLKTRPQSAGVRGGGGSGSGGAQTARGFGQTFRGGVSGGGGGGAQTARTAAVAALKKPQLDQSPPPAMPAPRLSAVPGPVPLRAAPAVRYSQGGAKGAWGCGPGVQSIRQPARSQSARGLKPVALFDDDDDAADRGEVFDRLYARALKKKEEEEEAMRRRSEAEAAEAMAAKATMHLMSKASAEMMRGRTAGEYGSYGERLHAEAAQIAESRKTAQDKAAAERLQHDLEGLQGRPTISEYSARIVVGVMK